MVPADWPLYVVGKHHYNDCIACGVGGGRYSEGAQYCLLCKLLFKFIEFAVFVFALSSTPSAALII